MKLKRRLGTDASIPTASTADIAFLLIIFFMATTIFKLEGGLPVVLPRAEMGVKVPRLRTTHIYVDRRGQVSLDDLLIRPDQIASLLSAKLAENPQLVVGLTMDEGVPYEKANAVIEQLKKADALNASFTVERK